MPKVPFGATGASRHQGKMRALVSGSLGSWGFCCHGIYMGLLELTNEEVSRGLGSWEPSGSPVIEATGVGRPWGELGSGFMGACWDCDAKDVIWSYWS